MEKEYSRFDIEDFAFDESFQQWVLQPDSPRRQFWDLYLRQHPHQTDTLLAARELVRQLHTSQQLPQQSTFADEIWQTIDERITPVRRIGWYRAPVWQAAAVALLVLGIGVGLWLNRPDNGPSVASRSVAKPTTDAWQEEVNRTATELKIHLSDGSVISLSKDSRLRYPRTFEAGQRVVYLTGEAFFEVARNPKKPFLVYANETVTKVLGTSFRIRAYDDRPDVTVSVRTGRVSVFARADFEKNTEATQQTGVLLIPNQQAVFVKANARLAKTLVEEPVVLAAPAQTPSFAFDHTPVSEVFATLETAYGIDIVYDPNLLAGRSLTVSLEDESLYEKLDVITKTLGVGYQVIDAQIVIGAPISQPAQ